MNLALSDAIELGNTLIGETFVSFYDPWCDKGCAIGSALAAIGRHEEGLQGARNLEKYFPIAGLELTLRERRIMSSGDVDVELIPTLNPGRHTLAGWISTVHCDCVPRMEIAKRVREIEAMHPEIPGYEGPAAEARARERAQVSTP